MRAKRGVQTTAHLNKETPPQSRFARQLPLRGGAKVKGRGTLHFFLAVPSEGKVAHECAPKGVYCDRTNKQGNIPQSGSARQLPLGGRNRPKPVLRATRSCCPGIMTVERRGALASAPVLAFGSCDSHGITRMALLRRRSSQRPALSNRNCAASPKGRQGVGGRFLF